MRSVARFVVLGCLLAAGCAASVGAGERGDGGAGPDGDAVAPTAMPTSSPTAMPSTTPTAMPSTTPTAGPTAPAPVTCVHTEGRVGIAVRRVGRVQAGCEGVMPGAPSTTEVRGRVTGVTATSLTVDACPPDRECDDSDTTFEVTAPGAAVSEFVPMNAFVHARLSRILNFQCLQVIHVRMLPEWEGRANPAGPGNRLLFAASEGVTGLAMDTQMELSVNPRNRCPAPPGTRSCGGPGPGEYEIEFLPINGTPSAVVPMGQSREFLLGIGAAQYRVRGSNLRSFETGQCDDYANYAWWVGALR